MVKALMYMEEIMQLYVSTTLPFLWLSIHLSHSIKALIIPGKRHTMQCRGQYTDPNRHETIRKDAKDNTVGKSPILEAS
jgi:hypothetical protein